MFHPDLWLVFRTHHGSKIVCMLVTLNGDTKITAGGTLLRIDAAIPIGSGLISLVCRVRAPNLTLATSRETPGMMSQLWHD